MPFDRFLRCFVLALIGVALGACTTTATRTAPAITLPARPAPVPAVCTTCGRIERIDLAPAASASNPRGAVLGGVVGGVLARPAPPPSAGAAAPANGERRYRVVVLLDSGRRLILTQSLAAGMKVGARVRVDRSRAVLLR